MSTRDKEWLKYALLVLAILVAGYFGVRYPLPEMPEYVYVEGIEMQAVGPTRFRSIQVDHDANVEGAFTSADLTCSGTVSAEQLTTTDDLTVADTLDVNGDIDLDGDGFDVNITGAVSIDADVTSNINVAGAGIDLTIESEAGSLVIKADEAISNALHLDANETVTTGIRIDVGSVTGLRIDGGMVNIGGGTCGVADGDNDVCIAGVLEVDDELELDGALDADSTANIAGAVTLQSTLSVGDDITLENGTTLGEAVNTVLDLSEFLAFTEQTAISLTAGAIITPTGTYQPLTSASFITTSTSFAIADGVVNGQVLILVNENASDMITIDDGANTKLGGDKQLNGGEGDSIWLIWDGSDWLCIGYNDN